MGFQGIATAGLFPSPLAGSCVSATTGLLLHCDAQSVNPACGANPCNRLYPTSPAVPNGMQWTGLVCNILGGCNCPADIAGVYATCPGGKIPNGAPLFTPIWGVGQINVSGGPVTSTLTTLGLFAPGLPSAWGSNAYVATWPSISIRATRGTPVVVKWVNEFPNNHVLCPHPEAADWPCAIDRTFMGVKARMDPALGNGDLLVPPEGVNQWGSPGQPDNSWVTHLHGGEIPPGTDGFAEKWFGNPVTATHYANVAQNFVQPPFENPSNLALKRPAGSSDIYTYPMVQEEATIWFHDHTLGKTHHTVIAGPAGFFPVKDLAKHGALTAWVPPAAAAASPPLGSDYTWLDPVTEPRGFLGTPAYDLFLAIQDRSFNDDGSINFSNGLGQTIPPAPAILPNGYSSITNGVNPQVHPVWVPEYFGDHALVNGVLWPKATVEPGWYRLRIVDGSDSRCYTIGFRVQKPGTLAPAAGTNVAENLPFYVIASDQGYLKNPVLAAKTFTMCPGERYELLVNFGALANGIVAGGAADVYMTNNAAAPFPAGFTPFKAGSPYPELNMIMKFVVAPTKGPGVKSCGAVGGGPTAVTVVPGASWDLAAAPPLTGNVAKTATQYTNICMPANPALVTDRAFCDLRPGVVNPPTAGCPVPTNLTPIVRQVYLNEKVDSVTLAPLGMQLNGVPFEYKVTETPKLGTRETWQFVNLTVDAHPMHPHLVQHQVVSRQTFNVGKYKAALCGGNTCMPGPAPGGEMQVVPDVTPFLTGTAVAVLAASPEGGFKDAVQVPPGMVTTIIADWAPRWNTSSVGSTAAPGVAGSPLNAATPYYYDPVTSGPYVWHCHINSHEDSEMMRTSLVVK